MGYLGEFFDAFDPASSAADDLFVLAAILAAILISRIVTRLRGERLATARAEWARTFGEQVANDIGAATGSDAEVQVAWYRRRPVVEVRVFASGCSVTYRTAIGERPGPAAQTILAAILSSLADVDAADEVHPIDEPVPEEAPTGWWSVLGIGPDANRQAISVAYRRLAMENHPDHGGSDTAMARINAARDEGLAAGAS